MQGQKVGPWRREDYESFLALALEPPEEPPRSRTLYGLMGLFAKEPVPDRPLTLRMADFVERGWEVRRAHPLYKTLQLEPNFKAAWSAFRRAAKRSKSVRLTSPTTPFRFLREFVRSAGHAYQFGGPATTKYGATSRRRRAASAHARNLLSLLSVGVSFSDYADRMTFRVLLEKLITELATSPRKEYGGVRQRDRWILNDLAHALIGYCDLKSPAVLVHFARMVDISCEPKTAQRYFDRQAKEWQISEAQVLAKALVERDKT